MTVPFRQLCSEAGMLSVFASRTILGILRRPFELREIVHQIFEIGWRSLPLIIMSGLAIGVVLSMRLSRRDRDFQGFLTSRFRTGLPDGSM